MLSFILRVGITLAGFYYASFDNLQGFVSCLIGFIIARFVIMRYTKPKETQQIELRKKVSHET
jgi:F1F0 ATPase subunit 2